MAGSWLTAFELEPLKGPSQHPKGGADLLTLPNGERRRFFENGDEIIPRASAATDRFVLIAFGECRATIFPNFQGTAFPTEAEMSRAFSRRRISVGAIPNRRAKARVKLALLR